MKYYGVQINKVSNGYIVNATKLDVLTKAQDNQIVIFKDFQEVIDFLKA
jgi:hypothetical protein